MGLASTKHSPTLSLFLQLGNLQETPAILEFGGPPLKPSLSPSSSSCDHNLLMRLLPQLLSGNPVLLLDPSSSATCPQWAFLQLPFVLLTYSPAYALSPEGRFQSNVPPCHDRWSMGPASRWSESLLWSCSNDSSALFNIQSFFVFAAVIIYLTK